MECAVQLNFKCRKCRSVLFSNRNTYTCHETGKTLALEMEPNVDVYYLRDDLMPSWMRDQVDVGQWIKGKLYCPSCKCRIGSFDFVSGFKCKCGKTVLPLHVVANKVDRESIQARAELNNNDP